MGTGGSGKALLSFYPHYPQTAGRQAGRAPTASLMCRRSGWMGGVSSPEQQMWVPVWSELRTADRVNGGWWHHDAACMALFRQGDGDQHGRTLDAERRRGLATDEAVGLCLALCRLRVPVPQHHALLMALLCLCSDVAICLLRLQLLGLALRLFWGACPGATGVGVGGSPASADRRKLKVAAQV